MRGKFEADTGVRGEESPDAADVSLPDSLE
jgi:hypothetical protein